MTVDCLVENVLTLDESTGSMSLIVLKNLRYMYKYVYCTGLACQKCLIFFSPLM